MAGLAAALELERRGVASLVVEKDSRLGGLVKGFCCKADERCVQCGACRLGDLLSELALRPRVRLVTQAVLAGARPLDGGWELDLEPRGGDGDDPLATPLAEPLTVQARAVVLAVGHTPFDPALKTRFGYGRVPGVMSALELEAMLGQGVLAGPDGSLPGRVAFIQCVGSRDQSLGRLWCSRVCCGYALRLARRVRHLAPDSRIVFFHMDVQDYGIGWEEQLQEMRKDFHFVRVMPGEVTKGQGGARVVFAGPQGSPQAEEFDLVALSVGLGPPAGAEELAGLFGLARTADGFLGREDADCLAGAQGVFVAGAARGPRSIVESIDHAALAAARVLAYLGAGEQEVAHA